MRGSGKIIRFLVEIVVLPNVIQPWLYMSRMYINISLGCNEMLIYLILKIESTIGNG